MFTLKIFKEGNLGLTALSIGLVPLINARKMLRFVLAQVVLTLAWTSGRVLICNPEYCTALQANFSKSIIRF